MTRVTIVGSGTSAPQPDAPASGILIETASTGILIDCGQGVIRELMPIRDPRSLDAIVVGHLHADHYIDLVVPSVPPALGRLHAAGGSRSSCRRAAASGWTSWPAAISERAVLR